MVESFIHLLLQDLTKIWHCRYWPIAGHILFIPLLNIGAIFATFKRDMSIVLLKEQLILLDITFATEPKVFLVTVFNQFRQNLYCKYASLIQLKNNFLEVVGISAKGNGNEGLRKFSTVLLPRGIFCNLLIDAKTSLHALNCWTAISIPLSVIVSIIIVPLGLLLHPKFIQIMTTSVC